jgi:hypothetical protein
VKEIWEFCFVLFCFVCFVDKKGYREGKVEDSEDSGKQMRQAP